MESYDSCTENMDLLRAEGLVQKNKDNRLWIVMINKDQEQDVSTKQLLLKIHIKDVSSHFEIFKASSFL